MMFMIIIGSVAIIISVAIIFYFLTYEAVIKDIVKGINKHKEEIDAILQKAIEGNWTPAEIRTRFTDYLTGENPTETCVAKKCRPVSCDDCIDCGFNTKSIRNLIKK